MTELEMLTNRVNSWKTHLKMLVSIAKQKRQNKFQFKIQLSENRDYIGICLPTCNLKETTKHKLALKILSRSKCE